MLLIANGLLYTMESDAPIRADILIDKGKDADIVIFEGNPLEINSDVIATIINGEIVWRNENQ